LGRENLIGSFPGGKLFPLQFYPLSIFPGICFLKPRPLAKVPNYGTQKGFQRGFFGHGLGFGGRNPFGRKRSLPFSNLPRAKIWGARGRMGACVPPARGVTPRNKGFFPIKKGCFPNKRVLAPLKSSGATNQEGVFFKKKKHLF